MKTAIWCTTLAFFALLTFAYVFRTRVETKLPGEVVINDAPAVDNNQLSDFRPVQTPIDGYVTSKECRDCHLREHDSWTASYHRTMTQVVSPETAMAGTEQATFNDIAHQRSYHMWWEGDRFLVRMHDPDSPDAELAKQIERSLVISTGSHHMQIYWYSIGSSRILGQLPIVYLKEEQRWIPRNAAFITPPDEGKFFSELGRWNFGCIECHTTHGRTRPQPDGSLDTRVAEFGIACEACHGPGEEHVSFRQSSRVRCADRLSLFNAMMDF